MFPSAFENRYWLKPFLHKNVRHCNSVTLKIVGGMGALEFLLKLDKHKPRRSDFHVVCKANNGTCQSHYHRVKGLGQKEGTSI